MERRLDSRQLKGCLEEDVMMTGCRVIDLNRAFVLLAVSAGAVLAFGRSGRAQGKAQPLVAYNPANHHYYQSVEVPGGLTWQEAQQEAAKRTYFGAKGHLVTLTDEQEYNFLVTSLTPHEFWIGAYYDPRTAHLEIGQSGWHWVTGEQWGFSKFGKEEPPKPDATPLVGSFWTAEATWGAHPLDRKLNGYLVEYPTTAPDPNHAVAPRQEVDRILRQVIQKYRTLRSYSATFEYAFKAHIDTVDAVRADFTYQAPNRFRLEGRSATGKVLANCEGRELLLAATETGEHMRYVIKAAPRLPEALKEAFSLLSPFPKLPGAVTFLGGAPDLNLWVTGGRIGQLVASDSPEQSVQTAMTVRMVGEDPVDGEASVNVSLDDLTVRSSVMGFRFKAYPFTAKETLTNVKLNEAVPPGAFAWAPPPGAERVDDVGEGDEVDAFFAPRAKR